MHVGMVQVFIKPGLQAVTSTAPAIAQVHFSLVIITHILCSLANLFMTQYRKTQHLFCSTCDLPCAFMPCHNMARGQDMLHTGSFAGGAEHCNFCVRGLLLCRDNIVAATDIAQVTRRDHDTLASLTLNLSLQVKCALCSEVPLLSRVSMTYSMGSLNNGVMGTHRNISQFVLFLSDRVLHSCHQMRAECLVEHFIGPEDWQI